VRGLYPQEIEVGTESLRRSPGAANQALGLGVGLDQREQSLADGALGIGGQGLARQPGRPDGGQAPVTDLLGHLAKGHLA
jgi:hypothetical protein